MRYLSPIAFLISSICWIVINLKAKNYQATFAWTCVSYFLIRELVEKRKL